MKFIQKHYSSKSVLQKQLWLEMDSDIILNKPDLNTWQCRGMVCRRSTSSRHINSTIFLIMYLPDLPLAIFQC